MNMTQSELDKILADHKLWLDDEGGSCANLSGADLSGANLSRADLSGANLSRAYLSSADLIGANLSRANLSGADLSGANLIDADLIDANLSGANLIDADLSRAYLSGANLSRAYLSGANLSRANLSGANLSCADLIGANLSGEILKISPVQVVGLPWNVLITQEFMVIGCQRHSHIEWADFSDEKIANMESRASEFWKVWKEPLLMMCSKYAAEYASV
jgi:hypothetical protein